MLAGGGRRRDRRGRATGPRRAGPGARASMRGFTVSERDFVAGVLERTGGRGARRRDRDGGRRRRGAPQQGLRGLPPQGPGRARRRRADPDPARQDLQEGDRLPDLDLLWTRPLRSELRGEGHDYPFGYVRWTEGRNLEEVLRQIARGCAPRAPADRRDARRRGRLGRLCVARLGEPPDRHPARLPPGRGRRGPARGPVPPDPPRGGAPRRPARSASESSATAATSARCCCRS